MKSVCRTSLVSTSKDEATSEYTSAGGRTGYAQTGSAATVPSGTVMSVALNGLSGSFGNIGRLKNNDQYWTTEYSYANGRPTGLAAVFLAAYLSI
jgi:hypothetical protein